MREAERRERDRERRAVQFLRDYPDGARRIPGAPAVIVHGESGEHVVTCVPADSWREWLCDCTAAYSGRSTKSCYHIPVARITMGVEYGDGQEDMADWLASADVAGVVAEEAPEDGGSPREAGAEGAQDVSRETIVIMSGPVISDRPTAIQVSGGLDGGGKVTFDIPETCMGAIAELVKMRRRELELTVRLVPRTGRNVQSR